MPLVAAADTDALVPYESALADVETLVLGVAGLAAVDVKSLDLGVAGLAAAVDVNALALGAVDVNALALGAAVLGILAVR